MVVGWTARVGWKLSQGFAILKDCVFIFFFGVALFLKKKISLLLLVVINTSSTKLNVLRKQSWANHRDAWDLVQAGTLLAEEGRVLE